MEIKKIGIKFGDNDFLKTFTKVLEIFGESFSYTEKMELTKDDITLVVNKLSHPVYLLFQDGLSKTYPNEFVESYIKITNDEVLINDEVDEHVNYLTISKTNNYECVFIDLTLHQPFVFVI